MRLPEDTFDTLYINADYTISKKDIDDLIKEHFGENTEVTMRADEIQIDHFGYDLYDSIDWANYIIVERVK